MKKVLKDFLDNSTPEQLREEVEKRSHLQYPHITGLGIKIHAEPYPHVLGKDLKKVLSKKDAARFHKFFGIQTCLVREDGQTGLYPWDVESVLVRMFEGKLTGTQLHLD